MRPSWTLNTERGPPPQSVLARSVGPRPARRSILHSPYSLTVAVNGPAPFSFREEIKPEPLAFKRMELDRNKLLACLKFFDTVV